MKILVVSNSIPYPPRNGVELPIANIIKHLSIKHKVDLYIITESKIQTSNRDFETFRREYLNNFQILEIGKESLLFSFLKEVAFIKPMFFKKILSNQNIDFKEYDLIWFSPIGTYNLSKFFNIKQKKQKIAIGLHESTVFCYLSPIYQVLKGTKKISMGAIQKLLRIPFIYFFEFQILKNVHLISVQTELEKKRIKKLYGKSIFNKTIIATNGIKKPKVKSIQKLKKNILFNTHLESDRKNESVWFLTKIWPKILVKNPGAVLNIFGTPPKDKSSFAHEKNIVFHGYVKNIEDIYQKMMISVIPTQHNTGWVNRVSDSLVFGVPIVACSGPLSTIPGIVPGKHALCANTSDDFSDCVTTLLNNREKREHISMNGKRLSKSFPTWDKTINNIEKSLMQIINKQETT